MLRQFIGTDGELIEMMVPGSFYEFISRDRYLDTVAGVQKLDLGFDAERIIDKATFEEPLQYSEGIHFVFVNGVAVVKDGQLVDGIFPGKAARAPLAQ